MKKLILVALLCLGCDPGVFHNLDWFHKGNWIVLMHNAQGAPLRCWKVTNTSIEYFRGAVTWSDPNTNAKMYVYGYNVTAIQIADENWAPALAIMGYSLKDCKTIQGKEPENPTEAEEKPTRPPNGP
jgi:hypothetical protein